MSLRHRWVTGAAAVAVAVVTAGCATYKVHPQFKTRHPSIHRVTAMPPDVEVYKLTFQGDKEMLSDLIPRAATRIQEEIEAIFTKKGYEIRKLDVSEAVLQQQPELRTALFTVRKMFTQTIQDIFKGKQKKFTYALSPPEINQFAELADTDVLIFVKCEGIKKSKGEIAKDVAKTILIAAASFGSVWMISPTNLTLLQVAVVDGDTADILWFHHNLGKPAGNVDNPQQLRAHLRQLFAVFPKAAGFKKPKASPTTPQAILVPETPVSSTVPTPEPAPQLPTRP